jgi:hypothetical protein
MTIVGKLEATGMPQHGWVHTELKAGRFPSTLNQTRKPFRRERRPTFGGAFVALSAQSDDVAFLMGVVCVPFALAVVLAIVLVRAVRKG